MKARLLLWSKRMIAIVCVFSMFVGIWKTLRYMITDDKSSFTRVMMHEYYNQDNIDVLFCGSSLCYKSFDVETLDNKLGLNTFNSGSSSQDLDATYYIIRDAVKRYDVGHIYLELSPIMAFNFDIDSRNSSTMVGTYIISDYMELSFSKYEYLLGASNAETYANSFLLARRNWQSLFDSEYVGAILQSKGSAIYKDFGYGYLGNDSLHYIGKGYVAAENAVLKHSFCDVYGNTDFDVNRINDEWYQYLQRIIELCSNNDVELTLVCSPLSSYLLVCFMDKYDDYHNMVTQIANEANIDFWDFTLCKEEYLHLDFEDYEDSAHLNKYGAKIFSELLGDINNGDINSDDIFYDSVMQKLDGLPANLCGIVENGVERKVIANHPEDFEYSIIAQPNEGEPYQIQDFSQNNIFQVRPEEHGTITITARYISDSQEMQKMIMGY